MLRVLPNVSFLWSYSQTTIWVWTWVYDSPMTFTILSGRWVGNTGCPAKSSTKGGHPKLYSKGYFTLTGLCADRAPTVSCR
jgi:hypothetical protein